MIKGAPIDRRKAALLGAFDRFNFGDLLFPIIVGNEIALHCSGIEIAVHAMADSDLSRFGAVKTHSFRALNHPGVLGANDLVIFAGGGIIGATWADMYKDLLDAVGNAALYYASRFIGSAAADTLSRLRFGGKSSFPWVASPDDFSVPVKVAYNAVGGSEFRHLTPELQERILGKLSKATFLSVEML